MKRISFDQHTATHLYEMALEHFCIAEGCYTCDKTRARLETFIGEKRVKEVKKVIRDNGYCNKLRGKRLCKPKL